MLKLLEFKIVLYDDTFKTEEDFMSARLSSDVERLATYSFIPETIVDIKETAMEYQKQLMPAVICCFVPKNSEKIIETPTLLVSYEQFKEEVNEYYKKEHKS